MKSQNSTPGKIFACLPQLSSPFLAINSLKFKRIKRLIEIMRFLFLKATDTDTTTTYYYYYVYCLLSIITTNEKLYTGFPCDLTMLWINF